MRGKYRCGDSLDMFKRYIIDIKFICDLFRLGGISHGSFSFPSVRAVVIF